MVGCLLGDRDTIYDPRLAHDRFLLGMQGSVYELELSMLRQRSREAQWQKAGRGELFTTVAVGYVKVGTDRIEMDPDQRVRDAIALVLKFAEFGSGRQVHLWFRQEGIDLPAVQHGAQGREVTGSPRVTTPSRRCWPIRSTLALTCGDVASSGLTLPTDTSMFRVSCGATPRTGRS